MKERNPVVAKEEGVRAHSFKNEQLEAAKEFGSLSLETAKTLTTILKEYKGTIDPRKAEKLLMAITTAHPGLVGQSKKYDQKRNGS